MSEDIKITEIQTTALTNLNPRQFGFETTNDSDLGWKMAGGMNADSEVTKFLGKDKAARVTTLSVTGDVTIISGTITIDTLSLSTAQSNQVMYGDFQQATTFKWQSSMLRIGSTNAPEYLIDVESTTQNNMRIENSSNDTNSPLFMFEKTTSSPADDDGCGKITFRGTNDDPSVPEVDYVDIEAFAADVSSNNLNGTLKIKTMVSGTQTDTLTLQDGGIIIKEESTQIADPLKIVDSYDTVLLQVQYDGSIKLPTIADTSASSSSLYYSSTQSKLVYKDSGGTVRDLW